MSSKLNSLGLVKQSVDQWLNQVNYGDDLTYKPSAFALAFVNFIKLVNGGSGEENTTPVLHLKMLDQIDRIDTPKIANMVFRGAAKTTVLGEYLLLYLAVFGELPTFGKINLAIYVSDSVENGVKNMRKNLEYRRENSPFLMKAIPHAKFTDIRWEFNNASGNRFIVKGYGGQALSLDTRLYTADGYTTMGACKTGDYIYGPDGKLAKITAKSEVFYKPMYSLNLADGRNLKVSHDHINSVMVNTTPNGYATWEDKNLTTSELLSMSLTHTKGSSTKHLVKVKNIEALEYPNKDLPLDPYTLGLILGDGSIKKNASGIVVTADEDDCAYYRKMIPYTLGDNYADTRRPNVKTFSVKGLNKVFRDLHLDVHGKDKFIPEGYFTASVEQRLALLQGLLDTDGSISDNGRITFTGASERLIDDVSRLVYSLGGKAHKAKPRVNLYKLEVWIGMNPFKLPRKADKYISGRQHWNNTNVISITRIADEPSQCIAIDNEDHQYVAGNYVRTHNTGVRGVKEMGVRPQLAIIDDVVSDEDARSQTCIDKIKDTVHNAIDHAMHPMGSKTIWSGTPFNASDPLYEAIESGSWAVNCYPVCEKFPCTKEEFRGAWENRFTYEHVRRKYEEAKNLGRLKGFNQELMLRIMSDEDRLVAEADINWYSRNDLLKNKSSYNYYITTDFATSERQSADYSVISVWAVNYLNQFFYVDGICKRQTMDKNVEDLFGLCSKYRPLSVGIEVSGQQEGFIPWLKKEQVRRQIYFNFASSNNSNKPGIRPSVDKLQRFYVVAPWFNAGNMFFPEELQTTPALIEALDELRLASSNGLKSKHDDFLDTISMLGCMHIIVPSQSQELSYNPDSNLWAASPLESSNESALKNYIV